MTETDENQNNSNLEETAGPDGAATPLETSAISSEALDAEPSLEEEDPQPAAEKVRRSFVWERWLLFLIAGGVILFDQYSKRLVESLLDLYTYWAPFPEWENYFRITHVSNTGVAFGLFQNGNTIFTILAVVVSIAIIIYNSRLEGGHKLLRVALGLQMGGALGNMIDRIRQGYVTDFMDFGPWPVWNVADLAIVSGTILLVLIMFHEERQEKKAAEQETAAAVEPTLETTTPPIDESTAS